MNNVNSFVEFGIGSTVSNTVTSTRRQLNALSDEQLHDIGVERGQLEDVARGLVARMTRPFTGVFAERGMSIAPLFRAYVSS